MDLRGFCFKRHVSLGQVESYLKQITAPRDVILKNTNKNCIEIGVAGNRIYLYEKFISMNYTVVSRYGGGMIAKGQECLFEVENISKLNRNKKDFSIGSKNRLRESQQNSTGKSTSTIRVQEGKLAQLHVESTILTISCNILGRVTEVDISLGSKRSHIITSIQMNRGQRVDLGRVVDQLSNKERNLSINTGATFSKTKGERTSDFYLILK
jgi:hypothetical protein